MPNCFGARKGSWPEIDYEVALPEGTMAGPRMNELAQFFTYCNKVFRLAFLVRSIRDHRPQAVIPTRPVFLTLLMGVVLRFSSYAQMASQTGQRRWQHLIHWFRPISHDTLGYVCERFYLDDLRGVLVRVNQTLKANKNLESCKINGLLFVSLDANEHFHSRSRCCASCCQRQIQEKDASGQTRQVTEYYHRYVFAQINGPKLNVLLDLEPIRPGEEEAGAALRLLGRMRRLYGVRFFDAITVDAWYVQGPFLGAVDKLGWAWVVVLKQERMDLYQEAAALSAGRKPDLQFHEQERKREIRLWQVKDLDFSREYRGKVWVVHSGEEWIQKKIIGGKKVSSPEKSDWWWTASRGLAPYGPKLVWQAGHRRWGIENKAFNELTQHYHLEHCHHHHPVAMLAQMLILLLGFSLFNAYALLHSQQVRLEQTTLKELAHQLDLALVEDFPWDQWFASG